MAATVSQVTGSSAYGTTTSAQSSVTQNKQLSQDDFLTMFMTQLKYQDPSNPMQSYELAAQLAQFTSVEQLTQVNSKLDELQSYLASSTNAQMMNLVGKEVTGTTNAIQWKDGSASTISYQLDNQSDVEINIYDSANTLIRTIKLSGQAAGSHDFQWDGKNSAGQTVSAGNYSYEMQAVDSQGNTQDIAGTISGTVYSFRLEDGNPYLIMNGQDGIKLSASNIMEVSNPDTEE